MFDRKGKLSLYEILGVDPASDHEQINDACWRLWERYKAKSTTALWKEVKSQIEEIHDTLLDPEARASYDEFLARKRPAAFSHSQVTRKSVPAQSSPPDAGRQLDASFYLVGMISAVFFHWMIEAISPESWAEMAMIGWLLLFFSGAMACLSWTVKRFFMSSGSSEKTRESTHGLNRI